MLFHIVWELRVQILKKCEDKPKVPLVKSVFMTLICLFLNGISPFQSAPKVILHPNKDFIFIMELYKLDKISRK